MFKHYNTDDTYISLHDWVEWAGYSIRTSEVCQKIETGERIPIYAYMTGKDSLATPVGFGYTVNYLIKQ